MTSAPTLRQYGDWLQSRNRIAKLVPVPISAVARRRQRHSRPPTSTAHPQALRPVLLALCLILCLLTRLGHAASSDLAPFEQANALYESGKFAQAAAAYEQCLKAGLNGPDVLYNLGNAYARQRQLGRALAAYSAARRLVPRDADLLHNIRQVLAQRAESPPIPRSWLATAAAALRGRFTVNELTFLCLVFLAGCTVLGVCVLQRRQPRGRLQAALAACTIVFLVLAWATVLRYLECYSHAPAFVCVGEAPMRTGPGESFEQAGALTDGAQVTAGQQAGVWTEITLPAGKRAWVRSDYLAKM